MLSTGDWRTRSCQFLHSLAPDGSEVRARWTEKLGLKPNPMGGFVEIRGVGDDTASPPYLAEEVRWVSEDLEPLGEWHRVFTWYPNYQSAPNIQLEMIVDRQGKALVLSYDYPKSFGPPAPPSTWKFMARWMGREGPLGEVFEPVAPTTIPQEGYPSFRGWGNLVRLAGGGIAAFRDPSAPFDPPDSTTSPAGWYAMYRSDEHRAMPAPAWVGQYDGSLQMVAGGAAYAATRRAPSTCARTALLIAPSGRTCFTLPLQDSGVCAMNDAFWPDGTLVAQDACQLSWWPGLAQLSR